MSGVTENAARLQRVENVLVKKVNRRHASLPFAVVTHKERSMSPNRTRVAFAVPRHGLLVLSSLISVQFWVQRLEDLRVHVKG